MKKIRMPASIFTVNRQESTDAKNEDWRKVIIEDKSKNEFNQIRNKKRLYLFNTVNVISNRG